MLCILQSMIPIKKYNCDKIFMYQDQQLIKIPGIYFSDYHGWDQHRYCDMVSGFNEL